MTGWQNSDRAARLPTRWPSIRARILRRDNYQCRIQGAHCTSRATEVDHIVNGDNHDPRNLQAVCHNCHAAKTAQEARQARALTTARITAGRGRPSEAHPGWVGGDPLPSTFPTGSA